LLSKFHYISTYIPLGISALPSPKKSLNTLQIAEIYSRARLKTDYIFAVCIFQWTCFQLNLRN